MNAYLRATVIFTLGLATAACSRHSGSLASKNIHMGMSESVISAAKRSFSFNPKGTFGDKVQYDSLAQDENGGVFVLHCKKDKCFSADVLFVRGGVKRCTAVSLMESLLPVDSQSKVREHDDWELTDSRVREPIEFFYFKSGARAELVYSAGRAGVTQLSVTQEAL